MSDNLDHLIAAAELGEESRKFLESDLGRCILGMAAQEASIAEKKLSTVDPTDSKTITALQNEVWRANSFEQWLVELLDEGEAAMNVFKQQS